jgi:hypothetical protein
MDQRYPPIPSVPSDQDTVAAVPLRFEDVTQDGRLVLDALPAAAAAVVWQGLIARHPLGAWIRSGAGLPILSRLVAEAGPDPIAVRASAQARGVFQLAHTEGPTGELERIILQMWAEVSAPIGRSHGPPPPRAGETTIVGRAFAEHVFTRPFGPPSERRILRLDGPQLPGIPPVRHQVSPVASLLDLPPDGQWLEPDHRPDGTVLALGIGHTDSNQHVNSLVYPRLFEEALLRRCSELGRPTTLLARTLEIAFRKPMFAGQRARILLRAFAAGPAIGATGAFLLDEDAAGPAPLARVRPHSYVRMWLEP